MKICSICHKISGTNEDHLDCQEKFRVETEAEDLKKNITEKLDFMKNVDDVQSDLKALMGHLNREKNKES
jgi:glycine cleavage system regulatory protein